MKRISCFILTLFMLLTFISPAYANVGEVRDHFYTLKFSDRYNNWNVYYHIPEIILGNKLDEELGDDIYTHYMSLYEESKKYADRKDSYPPTGNISYVCGQNEDIFSLVVLTQYMITPDYYLDVYNMDKSTGKAMTEMQVLGKFGYKTRDNFIKDVKKVLPDVFDELNSGAYPAVSKKEIEEVLDYTLSQDTLSWVKPYVNADGELCFIAWIASFAGSGAYLRTINLEKGTYEGDIQSPSKKISSYTIKTPSDDNEDTQKPTTPPYTGYRPHGDVNYDGTLDAKDATQILRYINGKTSVFSNQTGKELEKTIDVSEVNRDGDIDAKDATQILRKVNGKSSIFDTIA